MAISATEGLAWRPYQQLSERDPIGTWIGAHAGVGNGTGGTIRTIWNLDTGFMYMLQLMSGTQADANDLGSNVIEFAYTTGENISTGAPVYRQNLDGLSTPISFQRAAVWEPPKFFVLPDQGFPATCIVTTQNNDLQGFSHGCRLLVWPRNTFVRVPMHLMAVWLA